jgi:transcriptional regulator with XRE-family HTH domain
MKSIGSVIKPILKEKKLTQTDLAQLIGISRQQLNEILKRAEASSEVIDKIEKELDVIGELEGFRTQYSQNAYGMVVIQNQQSNERLVKELKARIDEQATIIEFLKKQILEKL